MFLVESIFVENDLLFLSKLSIPLCSTVEQQNMDASLIIHGIGM